MLLRQCLNSWAAMLLLMSAAAVRVHAADAETRAFNNAEEMRQTGFHERAEKAFTDFIAKYPASPRVPQALLLQARAAVQQRKFQPAIQLLSTNLANAAGIADQFQHAIAGIYAESGQFEAAATNFALLLARHTNSPLRLDATIEEARARYQLRQWPRVVALLQSPGGLLQQAAAQTPASETVVRGRMLLATTLLEQRDFAGAERAVSVIPADALTAKPRWEREFLIAQAQWGARRLDPALNTTSNLVTLATATADPALEAASAALQGEILEALNRPDEALAAYARNQRPGVPAHRTREALFKTVQLTVAQGQLTNALAKLEEFIRAHPAENGSDLALLTQAELRLKQHQLATNGTAPPVEALAEVIASCDRLIAQFTNSPFLNRAQLIRGWALLAQAKPADSLAAFRAAAEGLPWSEAQAVAWFKTADLEFQSGDLTNAVQHYRRVLTNYTALPRVAAELVPRARYLLFQASLNARELTTAGEAMEAILREYPVHDAPERTLLLYGQALDDLGDAPEARRAFTRLLQEFPASPLRPEVELAVARSFEHERNWPGAIAQYDDWVRAFPTNASRPRAEFLRAQANFLAGRDTNALVLFTNFVARFPLDPLAARAQDGVGDFYFRAGQYDDALRNYQLVFENTNWPITILKYQAKLKAGRAALLRPSFDNAAVHFRALIEDTTCPTSVLVQAIFAYGDAYLKRPAANALDNYDEARKIYAQVPRYLPADDPLVPRAFGEIANCYLQLGTEKEASYADALDYYGRAANAPTADISTRQQAQVGLGHVYRAQAASARDKGATADATALLQAALTNYLNVVFPVRDGDASDPVWVKEATLNASEICEARGEWDRAINLCVRLGEKIPALRPAVEKRLEAIRRRMPAAQP